MALPLNASFAGAAATLPDPPSFDWIHSGFNGIGRDGSGHAGAKQTSFDCIVIDDSNTYTNGQYSQVTLASTPDPLDYVYLVLNASGGGTSLTSYFFFISGDGSDVELTRGAAQTGLAGFTTVKTTTQSAVTSGDVFKLSNDGSGNITVSRNGSVISALSYADGSPLTGGTPGMGMYVDSGSTLSKVLFSAWTADDVSSGASGSGSPAEGHDTAAASGSSSTSGSAAITEGHDTAAGSGVAGAAGVAAITEGHDTASAAGSTSTSGSAAVSEGSDSLYGVGAGTSIFPLVHDSGNRFLKDQTGTPFPIFGFALWDIMTLAPSDWQPLIDGYLAQGFNTFEFPAIIADDGTGHSAFGTNTLKAQGTYLPFLKDLSGSAWTGDRSSVDPDLTTPNEAYFECLDPIVAYLESKGARAHIFPCYNGYQGTINQGFMSSMVANGATKVQAWGAWIANRYKSYSHICWLLGGDFGTGTGSNAYSGGQLTVEQALLAGIQSVTAASNDFSSEWADPDDGEHTDSTLNSAITILGVYSSQQGNGGQTPATNYFCRQAYASTPTRPVFVCEQPYDQEGPDGTNLDSFATQPCRRFQWWGVMSGINGYTTSNGYVWPCNPSVYSSHLATQTTLDEQRLHAFWRSIQWWRLVPDGQGSIGTLITAGNGTLDSESFAAAAATPSGDLLVSYHGPTCTQAVTYDMTKLAGTVRARWFDPTNAAYTSIGTYSNTGTQSFTVPGANNQGTYSDFVLVLDVPGAAAIPEGHDAVSASGSSGTSGSAAIAEGHDTVAGTGGASTSGSAAIAEPHDTAAGSGVAGAVGTASIAEGADAVIASGSTSTSGSAAVSESPEAVSATGSSSTSGSAAIAEGHDSVSGVGAAGGAGSGAANEGADIVAGSGSTSTSGSAAIAEGTDAVAGVGAESTSGSAAIAESHDSVAGSGAATPGGTGVAAIQESADSVSGSGSESTSGTGAISETADTAAGIGNESTTGAGSAAELSDAVSGSGAAGAVGIGGIAEGSDSVSGSGATSTFGAAAIGEQPDAASGVGSTVGGAPTLPDPRFIVRRPAPRRFTVKTVVRGRPAMLRFDPKAPIANARLTFDFTNDLPEGVTITDVNQVIVELSGVKRDAAPQNLENGSATVSGVYVYVPVQGGVHDQDYAITVSVDTSDPTERPAMSAILPVRLYA